MAEIPNSRHSAFQVLAGLFSLPAGARLKKAPIPSEGAA
jgi:peptide/nickel transport system permease protein